MIFYRSPRSLTDVRRPGQFPRTSILWRNTFIAWCIFGWGLLAGTTISEPQSAYGSFVHRFSVRHFGANSDVSELILAVFGIPGMLFQGFIAVCVIGGAFVGSLMLFTSIVVALHRSWRFDDAAVLSGHSETDNFKGPSFSL